MGTSADAQQTAVFCINRAHNINNVSGRPRCSFLPSFRPTDIFAGEPPPLPVALALAEVVASQKGGLTRRWFDRVLDARMADLERTQSETLEEMETWVWVKQDYVAVYRTVSW